jgi:hypothetical protein
MDKVRQDFDEVNAMANRAFALVDGLQRRLEHFRAIVLGPRDPSDFGQFDAHGIEERQQAFDRLYPRVRSRAAGLWLCQGFLVSRYGDRAEPPGSYIDTSESTRHEFEKLVLLDNDLNEFAYYVDKILEYSEELELAERLRLVGSIDVATA